MNALGGHLLVSLFFVMATMIEFAGVLVGKRKLDSVRNGSNNHGNLLKLGATYPKHEAEHTAKVRNAEQLKGMFPRTRHEKDVEIQQKQPMIQELGLLKESTLANRIDFAAFVMFIFSYLVFNVFYWVNYLKI